MCRIAAFFGLALSPTALAEEGRVEELELVRAALQSPPLASGIEAARERGRAEGTATPSLQNPSLDARREQANGPAGASTEAIGGSLVLDLGMPGLAERRAAALRSEAGEAWLHAEALSSICGVREGALELWLAEERHDSLARAHERIEVVEASLDALAEGGEASSYERGRLELRGAAHGLELDQARLELESARARLQAWTGEPASSVLLAEPLPLDSLDELLVLASASDPVLQALLREREAATASLASARRAAVPDLELSGGARWDALPDGSERSPGYELGLSVELPLADRNQAQVAAARADLAELEARVVRREAELHATIEAAWRQVEALGPMPPSVAGEATWEGARARYAAGEGSLDELLAVATEIEQADLASLEGAALRRRARLELSCASGSFPEPAFQSLLEETLR